MNISGTDLNKKQLTMAMLVIAGRSVLIRQDEIKGIEPSADILLSNGDGASVGSLTQNSEDIPVFAMDKNLDLLPQFPSFHPVCVLFNNNNGKVGLLCERVQLNAAAEDNIQGLPELMRGGGGLISGVAIVAGVVVSVSSAAQFIQHLNESRVAPIM